MMLTVFYVLIACAIGLMVAGLFMALKLRRLASGGAIGRVVTILLSLVALFVVAYLFAPLLPSFSPEITLLIVGVVFLAGSLYVVLVLRLVAELMQKVLGALELDEK
jgi:hypothetical protein